MILKADLMSVLARWAPPPTNFMYEMPSSIVFYCTATFSLGMEALTDSSSYG